SPALGPQWQWQANPGEHWHSLSARPGALRLYAQSDPHSGNLYEAPHLLMQKFPALEFAATTKIDFAGKASGDAAGLVVFGRDYAWIGLRRKKAGAELVLATRRGAAKNGTEEITIAAVDEASPCFLRVTVRDGAKCQFSHSADGENFTDVADIFSATPGR